MAQAVATAAVIGLGAGAAALQFSAGRQAAKSAMSQAEYNAGVYEQQAGMIQEQKKLEAYQYQRRQAKLRGSILARTASSGLRLSGSPLAIMVDSEAQMALDEAVGQYNLDISRRYALSGADYYRKTGLEQGKLAKTQGYMNTFTTLLRTGMMARGI